ncbi:restriction endonuclease subunit S [Corallococcus sp. CA049B]|uniref:restriction endonuclease subunit S n=1 Tax=Corallococcus sp. CA049B TaxID=2316730 RepID=UPI000EA1BDEE|nr:restriction endonuclease subunit S [Corallococcus sp. CA049B]RKG87002.1 restriction endonuclease subunit S [Corallococcus sp. CA049B]
MSFPRYPEYKDSGVEWLGEVPAHWAVTKLSRIVTPHRPITYGIVQAGPHVPDGIPYVRPADMSEEEGVRSQDEILRASAEVARAYSRSTIKTGDLVCSIGPSFGKVMVTPAWLNGANLTQGTARIAVAASNSSRYVFWVLRSESTIAQWESSVGGATFRALNLGPLSATVLVLPPPSEQAAIAAFLDRETTKVDELVAEQHRLIELLKEKREAVISHAVTKGLNPSAPMKGSGIDWLGQIPSHWSLRELRHLIKAETTITYGIVQAGPDTEGGVPYIRTSDMSGESLPKSGYLRTTHEIDAAYRRSKVIRNDLVVAIRASLGKGLLVPDHLEGANLTQGTARVSPGAELLPKFLLRAFNSDYCQTSIRIAAKGTTFLEITLDELRRIPLAVPPIEEQLKIAETIDSQVGKFDDLIHEAMRAEQLLGERRTALISAAVTGQIDVRAIAGKAAA